MVKVKALYHFLDRKACRNRMQGQVFDAPEEIAEELEKAGLVEILEPKSKTKTSPDTEPDKEQAEVQEKPKRRKR